MVDPQLRIRRRSVAAAVPAANGPFVVGERAETGFELRTLVDDAAARAADPARTRDAPARYGALVAASGHVTRAGYCSPREEQPLAPALLDDHGDTICEGAPQESLPRISAPRPHAAAEPDLALHRAPPLVLAEPRGGMSPEIVRYALLVALLAVVGTAAGTALGLLFRAL